MDIKWIKLQTDVFNNRKIRLIESLPDGDSLIVIWFKILCLAGQTNDSGLIYFTKEMPYTEEMLATILGKPVTLVKYALKTFEQFGMLDKIDDFYALPSWEEYQNIEGMEKVREQTRKRVANHRERQKALLSDSNATCNVTVTQCNAIEIDTDKEKEIDIYSQRFDEFWKAYPKKVGKKDAQKSFYKLKPSQELTNKMISVVEQAKDTEQWLKNGGQYIPNPSTWLNQGRWEDEIESYGVKLSAERRKVETDRFAGINY